MLCAASMMLLSSSRRLLSTSRATKGNAAATSGTMVAVVPTAVPIRARESGSTIIMRMRNGIERRRLMMTFKTCMSHAGRGRMPSFSPVTKSTPRGSPITSARRVLKTVT